MYLYVVSSFVNRLPDEDAGEVPFAYVVRAKGSSLQERDVIEFVAPRVLYRLLAIVVFYVIFCSKPWEDDCIHGLPFFSMCDF